MIVYVLCSIVAIPAFILIASCLWFYMDLTCLGPLNPPTKSWNDFKNQSFVVGIDLTAGYGTAAVAFMNGTIFNVARVEGTPEYNDVLARLSLKSSAHATPPYYSCPAQRSDLRRQWGRYFRKRRGLPASDDVSALAEVLRELKFQTDAFLAPLGPLEVAFLTVPNLPALYLEDLIDAADHVQVQLITLPWYIYRSGDQAQWPVSEINTAMAGNRIGLLESYPEQVDDQLGDKSNTNNDGRFDPRKLSDNVLSVLFTEAALTAYVGPFASASHFYWVNGIANFSLGLSHCTGPPSERPAHCTAELPYWYQVRLALREALGSYLDRGKHLDRVISYGESAHNEIFDRVLREEVLAAQSNDDPDRQLEFSSEDPVFAGARGAAEFAKLCTKLSHQTDCFPNLSPRMPGW